MNSSKRNGQATIRIIHLNISFWIERFNEQYKADETQYKLLSNLSYICIFISLLGFLGLSAFTAAQRTKEIGIRKVHGASLLELYICFTRTSCILSSLPLYWSLCPLIM